MSKSTDQAPRPVEIYVLIDPRDGLIRYVGKSTCAQRRFNQHLKETRRDYPVYRWIAKLRSEGLAPLLKIERVCGQNDWKDAEREVIARERAASRKLLNVADGGDEPYCPTEVRAANGRANAKKRVSDPGKAKIWELKQMLGVALKHGWVSEKTKAKLRALAASNPAEFGKWAAL